MDTISQLNNNYLCDKLKYRVKFEVFGKMMIEKKVKLSGNSGRVYVPLEWVHHHVKIIRID